MAKLSLEELRALRAKESARLEKRDIHGKRVHVVVGMGTCGMGTCGIQAGAKVTLNSIVDEIEARGLKDVIVTQAGCQGRCDMEPVVEVYTPSLGAVAYGKVDAKLARRIVDEHIVGGKVIDDHRIDLEG